MVHPILQLIAQGSDTKMLLNSSSNWLNLTVFSFEIMNSNFRLLILICSLGLLMTCNQSQFDPTKFQTPQTEHFIFCFNFSKFKTPDLTFCQISSKLVSWLTVLYLTSNLFLINLITIRGS